MSKFVDHPLPGSGAPSMAFRRRAPSSDAEVVGTIPYKVRGATKRVDMIGDVGTWNVGARDAGMTVHAVRVLNEKRNPDGSVDADLELTIGTDAPPGLGFPFIAIALALAIVGGTIFGITKADELIDKSTEFISDTVGPEVKKTTTMLTWFMGAGVAYWAGTKFFGMSPATAGALSIGASYLLWSQKQKGASA